MKGYKDQGYQYISIVIDVYSKYAWGISIKRMPGEKVSTAFRELFKQRIPRKLNGSRYCLTPKHRSIGITPQEASLKKNEGTLSLNVKLADFKKGRVATTLN